MLALLPRSVSLVLHKHIFIYYINTIWDFSEMFVSRIDRLVRSAGGPPLIQFIFGDCVSAK